MNTMLPFLLVILLKIWRSYYIKNAENVSKKRKFSKYTLLTAGLMVFETLRITIENIVLNKIATCISFTLAMTIYIFLLETIKEETKFRERNVLMYTLKRIIYFVGLIFFVICELFMDELSRYSLLKSNKFFYIFLFVTSGIEILQIFKRLIDKNQVKILLTMNLGLVFQVFVNEVSIFSVITVILAVDIYILEASKDLNQDSLTKLHNRRFLESEAIKIFAGRKTSLLFIDIDRFKRVNDEYGHHMGDKVLCDVAEVIRSSVRKEDYCIRFAGDEFVIIARAGNDKCTGNIIKDRILRTLIKYNTTSSILPVSLSIGVIYLEDGSDIKMALKKADKLLYEEKKRHHEEEHEVKNPKDCKIQ